MTVAQTILAQLGGNKFKAMTGAKNFCSDKNALIFDYPSPGVRARCVIELKGDDTYTMKFFKQRKFKVTKIEDMPGVYCDQLQELFTKVTGLYTSL
jgi:hypothetical protein